MHKIKTFKIPIYFGELRIVVSDDFDASFKKLKVNCSNYDLKAYDSFVWDDSIDGYSRYSMIFMGTPAPPLIAHESLHVVNLVFKDRLIKPDLDNDEPQAYLLGWVVECVGKAIDANKDGPIPAKVSV